MAEKISELEKAALAEKPWQLSGEVTAQTRPENSMLEEDVDFDQASRMGKDLSPAKIQFTSITDRQAERISFTVDLMMK